MMLRCFVALGLAAPTSGHDHVYDPVAALEYVWLSAAAYCGHPKLPNGQALRAWECGPACDAVPGVIDVRPIRTEEWDDAFAVAVKQENRCVLAFRGTSNILGWILADAKSAFLVDMNEYGVECSYEGSPCNAGHGFMQHYKNIQDEVLGNLTELGCKDLPVAVTGHSLGGALAGLAMIDLDNNGFQVTESYTFGCPRIGDPTFVRVFHQRFESVPVFRVTNCLDPVPHLPMRWLGFDHVDTEIYYDCTDPTSFRVCDATWGEDGRFHSEDPRCAQQWGLTRAVDDCRRDIDNCDHSTYLRDETHVNLCGVTCHDAKATCGGTAKTARCMFPFEYRGKNYNQCTETFWTQPWCYTDAEGHWGECNCQQIVV